MLCSNACHCLVVRKTGTASIQLHTWSPTRVECLMLSPMHHFPSICLATSFSRPTLHGAHSNSPPSCPSSQIKVFLLGVIYSTRWQGFPAGVHVAEISRWLSWFFTGLSSVPGYSFSFHPSSKHFWKSFPPKNGKVKLQVRGSTPKLEITLELREQVFQNKCWLKWED